MSDGGGAISDDDELQAQDPRQPRGTTAPMRVAQFIDEQAQALVVVSEAAKYARRMIDLTGRGRRRQDMDPDERQSYDAWVRVEADAMHHRAPPKDRPDMIVHDITMENIALHFGDVLQRLQNNEAQSDGPARTTPWGADYGLRGERGAEIKAALDAARQAGEDEDPFTARVDFNAAPKRATPTGHTPVPDSTSRHMSGPSVRKPVYGAFHTEPAFQEERQVEAASSIPIVELPQASVTKTVATADATKQKREEAAASKKTTTKAGFAAGRALDSVAELSYAIKPQTRARANREAKNVVEPSSNTAPDEFQNEPVSDRDKQGGRPSVDQGLDSNQGGKRAKIRVTPLTEFKRVIKKDSLEMPKVGFAASLTLEEVEWIFQWIYDWDYDLAGQNATKKKWIEKVENKEKVWQWYYAARDEFIDEFKTRKGGKMPPSFIHNDVTRGKLWAVWMHRLEEAKAEAELGGKAQATEPPKSTTGPARRRKRVLDEDNEDTRSGSDRPRPKRIRQQTESQPLSAGLATRGQGQTVPAAGIPPTKGKGRAQRGSAAPPNHGTKPSATGNRVSKARAAKGATTSRKPDGKGEKKSLVVRFAYKGSFPPTPKKPDHLRTNVPQESSTTTRGPLATAQSGIEPSVVDGESDEEMTG